MVIPVATGVGSTCLWISSTNFWLPLLMSCWFEQCLLYMLAFRTREEILWSQIWTVLMEHSSIRNGCHLELLSVYRLEVVLYSVLTLTRYAIFSRFFCIIIILQYISFIHVFILEFWTMSDQY
jgi:hypothetical protein